MKEGRGLRDRVAEWEGCFDMMATIPQRRDGDGEYRRRDVDDDECARAISPRQREN